MGTRVIQIGLLVSIYFVVLVLGRTNKVIVINGNILEEKGLISLANASSDSVSFENFEWNRNISSEDLGQSLCNVLTDPSNSIMAIIDTRTMRTTQSLFETIGYIGIPYYRIQFTKSVLLNAVDNLLSYMDFTDISFVVDSETSLNETIFFVLGQTKLRTTGTDLSDERAGFRLQKMRPSSTNYVSWGTTDYLQSIYRLASSKDIIKRDVTWIFMHTDFEFGAFNNSMLISKGRFLTFNEQSCCGIKPGMTCQCKAWKKGLDEYITHTTFDIIEEAVASYGEEAPVWSCTDIQKYNFTFQFKERVKIISSQDQNYSLVSSKLKSNNIRLPLIIDVNDRNNTHSVKVGYWQNGFNVNMGYTINKLKKIYRIGTVMGLPWAFFQYPNGTKSISTSAGPEATLEGYFPSLLYELKTRMNFEYELILTQVHGKRSKNGSWTGVVNKLVSGEIDICLTNLIMTTEREEVIDFITPYIDMTGISIIIRKKKTTQSIFKFMTVLKFEVWIGTLVAVGVVTLLIWILERLSPYSYSNAEHLYPEGGRQFSLGESLWFAVTSLTPQGGGECPKALSGRILVAAYWLFIVLMLATFTSNLAAFLTVERLEKTIQSMEELVRHPKITYTVMEGNIVHQHFVNMANAERVLFEKWKNLTLNSGAQTQSEYRVWDYPIQEQYFHILQVVNRVGTVSSAEEGFQLVEDAVDGDFAFLHDTMEVKFQYFENCNFIMVGQPLAEQPISIAVQQGSRLKKPLSMSILELQKERFFEKITKKYWSIAKRDLCPILDESQGITLQSLGGIFLAALAGLVISMIVLAIEVWKRKQRGTRTSYLQKTKNDGPMHKEDLIKIGPKQVRVSPINSSLAVISKPQPRMRRQSRSTAPFY